MAAGVSGYIEFTPSVGWAAVRVYYEETYDVATNKSTLTITSIKVKSTNWYGVTYYPDGLVKINGTTVLSMNSNTGTHTVSITAQNKWYNICKANTTEVATGTLASIEHANDGTKTISIEITGNRSDTCKFYTISGNYGSGWSVDESKDLALTKIPRASSIGATDAEIGSVSSVVVTKKASSYKHSIKYEFGSLSGYLKADGTLSSSEVKMSESSIAFAIPASFSAQMTNVTSKVCTLTCVTYSGTTQIGDAQTTTFKVTTNKSESAPTVSGTVQDSLDATIALTGDKNKLIRYCSNALCTISASPKNNATIVTKKIAGTEVSGNSITIENVETGSIKFEATDSRGYTSAVTVKKTLIKYIKLTVNAVLQRTDPTSGNATLSIRGDCFKDTFGAVTNVISAKYRIAQLGGSYGSYKTISLTFDGNTYSADVALSGLNYEYAYKAQVVVTDKIGSVAKTVKVAQGIPVFDWGENDFSFNVPVAMAKNGFGVPGNQVPVLADANDAVSTGWYRTTSATANSLGALAIMRVDSTSDQNVVQTAYSGGFSDDGYTIKQRHKRNGIWSSWKWVNPPLMLEKEYPTTELYLGKTVYVKVVNFEALPASKNKNVAYTTENATPIDVRLLISDGCVLGAGYGRDRSFSTTSGLFLDITKRNVRVYTEADFSSLTAYAIVQYTKDSEVAV